MCRLPIELVSRIITFSQRPLPATPDDSEDDRPLTTWADVCQPELATLMRTSKMTYCLAAPLLYKEAVFGNFESFFFGFDAPSPTDSQDTSTRPDDGGRSSMIHKRELLKLVEAVHIVYSPQDATFYGSASEHASSRSEYIADDAFDGFDTSRHLNVPDSLDDLSLTQVFPKLLRSTIGLWNRNGWDRTAFDLCMYEGDRDIWDFERELAGKMFQFTPSVICRTHWYGGLLSDYPASSGDIRVSVLHETFEGSIETSMFPGARHYLHIDVDDFPRYGFSFHVNWLYDTVIDKMTEWTTESNVSLAIIRETDITFVVHHPFKEEYDKSPEGIKGWHNDIQRRDSRLRNRLHNNPHPTVALLGGWDKWRLIPEEEFPACPACQPVEYKRVQEPKSVSASVSSS